MKKRKKVEDKKEIKKRFAIWIVLLILFILLLILNSSNLILLWDENVYLGNARSHLTKSNFTEDFRFPFLEWIIAFVWFFIGESIFVARTVSILFALATIFLLYLVSKKYFTWQFSIVLCALFALSPLMLLWSFRVYTDIPAMFFCLLSFYFLLKGEEKDKKKVKVKENKKKNKKFNLLFVAFAGIASALAFLTRFPLALFPFSVLIYFIIKKKSKEFLIFFIFFIAMLAPWLVYNQMMYHNPLWDVKVQFSAVAQYTFYEPFMKQVSNLFIFSNFLISLLLPFGIYIMIKKKKMKNLDFLILIYLLISFIYYFFFVKLKEERYCFAFLPFIYLVSFRTIEWVQKTKRKKVFSILLIVLIIGAFFSIFFVFDKFREKFVCDRNNSIMKATNYLKDKIDANDIVLSNAWPWFGYYLNVKAVSLWSENVAALVHQYRASYVIYNDRRGIEFNKELLDNCAELKLEKEFIDSCGEKTYVYRTSYAFSNNYTS